MAQNHGDCHFSVSGPRKPGATSAKSKKRLFCKKYEKISVALALIQWVLLVLASPNKAGFECRCFFPTGKSKRISDEEIQTKPSFLPSIPMFAYNLSETHQINSDRHAFFLFLNVL